MAEWPDKKALEDWIGTAALGDESSQRMAGIVTAATTALKRLVDPAKLPEDENDCPDDFRLAILIYAHRLLLRPGSANGVIGAAGADFAIRVGRSDPDVVALIHPFRPDLDP